MQVLDVLILYIHRFIGLLIFSGHIDIHSPYIPRVHSFFRSFTHSFLVIHRQLRWNQRADTHQCFCSQCYRDWTVDRTCRHCLQNTRFLWRWQLPPGRDSCCCCAVIQVPWRTSGLVTCGNPWANPRPWSPNRPGWRMCSASLSRLPCYPLKSANLGCELGTAKHGVYQCVPCLLSTRSQLCCV